MLRVALITFLISCCARFFSQPIYSRDFETRKKNVPLAIINNHPNYFFLLRYNKAAHDITIERRAKPSAEIISFTPLKLDSVNANWFDYEKLDYAFFEHNYCTYFLFERVLNSKRALYLKIIDTLGRSSGFIELASVEKEKGVTDIRLEFKRTKNDHILIIASQIFSTFANKRTAVLFDIEKRKIAWTKKLPIENIGTGYSVEYNCNEDNELFCIMIKAHVASFKRVYINHSQVQVPVLFFDTLTIAAYLNNAVLPNKRQLAINNLSGLNSIQLIAAKKNIIVSAQFAKQDSSGEKNSYFYEQKLSNDLSEELYATTTPFDNSIKESLTFYDGTDFKEASEKNYRFLTDFRINYLYCSVAERTEEYYCKELLCWKTDLETGVVSAQKIIPRKVYSFQGRTRFKNIGTAMPFIFDNKLAVMTLESPSNFKKDPNVFNYHKFKKETNLWHSNLVMYLQNDNGTLEKYLLYQNSTYDAIPMSYQTTDQKEIVLYLNNGRTEKFVILKPGQP